MRRKKVNDGACNREYFRVAAVVEELFFNRCNSHIEPHKKNLLCIKIILLISQLNARYVATPVLPMTTIAGSALDLDLLGANTTENNNNNDKNKNNAASSSRPSSRLARHSSDDQQQPGENKDENKNKNSISSSSLEKQSDQKTFFFRCQKCRTPLEVERITGDDDGDHAKFIAETSGKLKVTVGEKQFRDFLLDEDAEEMMEALVQYNTTLREILDLCESMPELEDM